jgi:hypothetical protein
MIFKAAFVFVAGGLMGSGIVALTRPGDAPQSAQLAALDSAAAAPAEFHHETNRQGYVQARFAAQRPFAALGPVTRQ